MSSKSCTNRAASASIWPPITAVTALENSANPAPRIFITPRLGAASSRIIRPSRNDDRRCGASRKSRADRLGGVSTTIRSNVPGARPAARASPSPCTPGCRRTTWRWSGRTGWRGSVAARSGVECAATISSNVRLVSSIIAQSSPSGRAPRSDPPRVVVQLVRDRATGPAGGPGRWSAPPPSGPASAACTAIAAAVVVLPTPPDPQVTTHLGVGASQQRLRGRGRPASSARLPGRRAGRPARRRRRGRRRRPAAAATASARRSPASSSRHSCSASTRTA